MAVEIHEILTRLRTELDPKGFEDAMKLLFNLEKAGLAFNKMLGVAAKQYLEFTDAAAEAIRGIKGPITKQLALTIAAKVGQAGYNKAMEEARKEIRRYISENEKLRAELLSLKKAMADVSAGLTGLTRTKRATRREIRTLADVIATLTKPEVEMLHKALIKLVWGGLKAEEAIEHLVEVFKRGKVVVHGTTLTSTEYLEVLGREIKDKEMVTKLTERYKDEMEKLDKSFKEAERSASAFVTKLDLKTVALTAAGLAAVAYVRFLKSAITETARWAEETWKMSLMLGTSEEQAIKFSAAAELVGLRASALVRPFSILLTQIRRVHKDTINAVKITNEFGEVVGLSSARLGMYGLALTDTAGRARPFWDIMADLSDLYIKLGRGTDALVLAQAAFGFQYRHLLPLLELGGERWRALGERLGELSGLTEEHIETTMDYVFAQRELGMALRGFRMELAVHILPLLTDFLKILTELISKYGDLSIGVKDTVADILAIVATLGVAKIAKLALVKAIGLLIAKLGLAGTTLGTVLGAVLSFVTGLWKVVAVIGVVVGAIELLELALGREIIAWGDYIERLKEWIGVTEEAAEAAERITFPPMPPAPPAPPFPWTPLLEQMAADYVEVWSEAVGIARSNLEAELREMGFTAEEVADIMRYAMAEARTAIAEFLAGTRENVTISVQTLAGTVTFTLSQVLDFLRLQIEMVQAERAVEAARRAVSDIRDSISELKRYFREEVETRREQVELARERLASAREAVAALRDQLSDLRRTHREELKPYQERLRLARERVEEAREVLELAREVLEAERERRAEIEEAQRERIEVAEDQLELARDEVEKSKELLEELQERIDAEVQERLRLLGIIIDPTRLEALKDAVAEAKDQVEDAKAALEDARARRRRYGLMLISWEEINAQAALEIAEAAQRQAESALREEERRHRLAREVRREVERQYAAEREEIEETIRLGEERVEELRKVVEAERERLEELKEIHKEELKPFEERIKQAELRLKSERQVEKEARRALEEIKKRQAEEIEALERRIDLAEEALRAQKAFLDAEERAFEQWKRALEERVKADEERLQALLRLREAELEAEESRLERLREELSKRKIIADAREKAMEEYTKAMEEHKKAMTIIEKLMTERMDEAKEAWRTYHDAITRHALKTGMLSLDASEKFGKAREDIDATLGFWEALGVTIEEFKKKWEEADTVWERVFFWLLVLDWAGVWTPLSDAWKRLIGWAETFGQRLGGISNLIERLNLIEVIAALRQAWERLYGKTSDISGGLGGIVTLILGQNWSGILDIIRDGWEKMWSKIKSLRSGLDEVWRKIRDWNFSEIFARIKSLWEQLWEKIKSLFRSLRDLLFGRHSPSLVELISSLQGQIREMEQAIPAIVAAVPLLRPRVLVPEALARLPRVPALEPEINVNVMVEGIVQPVRIKTEIEPPGLVWHELFR